MGWRAVLDLVPHAAYITSEQYFGIMLLLSDSASSSLKTWFGTLVVEACTTENDRSLTSLIFACVVAYMVRIFWTHQAKRNRSQCSSYCNKVHVHIHQNNSTLHAQFLNDSAKPPAILVAFSHRQSVLSGVGVTNHTANPSGRLEVEI